MFSLKSTIPPTINRNVFDDFNLSVLSLYVPNATALASKVALVWQNFYAISESRVVLLQTGQVFHVDDVNYVIDKATLPYGVGVTNTKNLVGEASYQLM